MAWISSREDDEECSDVEPIWEVEPIRFAGRLEVGDTGKKNFFLKISMVFGLKNQMSVLLPATRKTRLGEGLPGGTSSKEPTCKCKRRKRHRFRPWVGKIPWRGAWQPTPVFFPGESNPMDRGAWRATVHGVTKSWTRLEQLGMRAD